MARLLVEAGADLDAHEPILDAVMAFLTAPARLTKTPTSTSCCFTPAGATAATRAAGGSTPTKTPSA